MTSSSFLHINTINFNIKFSSFFFLSTSILFVDIMFKNIISRKIFNSFTNIFIRLYFLIFYYFVQIPREKIHIKSRKMLCDEYQLIIKCKTFKLILV